MPIAARKLACVTCGDILPVDRDPPAGQVVEAVHQPRERRLARARRPDHRERLARRDVEVDALQDRHAGIVAEAHVLEPDMPAADDQRLRVGRVDHLARRIDQVEHRAHVDHALADRAIDHAEQVERAEQLREQRRDEHHVARGEAPLRPSPRRRTPCRRRASRLVISAWPILSHARLNSRS